MKRLKDLLLRAIRMSGVTADMAAGVTLVAIGAVVSFGFAMVIKVAGDRTSAGEPFDEEAPIGLSRKHANEKRRHSSLSLVKEP